MLTIRPIKFSYSAFQDQRFSQSACLYFTKLIKKYAYFFMKGRQVKTCIFKGCLKTETKKI